MKIGFNEYKKILCPICQGPIGPHIGIWPFTAYSKIDYCPLCGVSLDLEIEDKSLSNNSIHATAYSGA